MQNKTIRVATDVGGTFTDLVCFETDRDTGQSRIITAKSDTTPPNFEQGVLNVLEKGGVDPATVDFLAHGTTVVINALTERKGVKVALVTTEGFRDVIEMRTESRFDQYDLNLRLPTPLVPREDRFTVAGRIGAQGQELAPLDEAALAALADRIAAGGFGAVAIGFIHSYMNPAHERRAREIIAARVGLPISISSEVSPQMREYERFNTVCANAYVRPQMADYVTRALDPTKAPSYGVPGDP